MKILGKALALIFKGSIGLIAIYFTNLVLVNYNMAVGMNFYNGLIIGFLGISGYFLLYILVLLDRTIL